MACFLGVLAMRKFAIVLGCAVLLSIGQAGAAPIAISSSS